MDQLIVEFDTEKEVEEERNRRRQEKAAKRYTNLNVQAQDEVDWDEAKQEAEPCPSCGHFYTMAIESRGGDRQGEQYAEGGTSGAAEGI